MTDRETISRSMIFISSSPCQRIFNHAKGISSFTQISPYGNIHFRCPSIEEAEHHHKFDPIDLKKPLYSRHRASQLFHRSRCPSRHGYLQLHGRRDRSSDHPTPNTRQQRAFRRAFRKGKDPRRSVFRFSDCRQTLQRGLGAKCINSSRSPNDHQHGKSLPYGWTITHGVTLTRAICC